MILVFKIGPKSKKNKNDGTHFLILCLYSRTFVLRDVVLLLTTRELTDEDAV